MSDKHIEKSFLYLVLVSFLIHAAVFSLIPLIPKQEFKSQEEPPMVELRDLPLPLPEPKPTPQGSGSGRGRHSLRPVPNPIPTPPSMQRQARQQPAPRTQPWTERLVPRAASPTAPSKPEQAVAVPGKQNAPFTAPDTAGKAVPHGDGLLRPQRGEQTDLAKLFPTAKRMQKLEESYRKKYEDVEQGDTRLMDTDDPVVGLFGMRFRNALKDRLNAITPWEVGLGRGVTVLNIAVRRDGSIEAVKLLESTGNRQLDDLAIRASRNPGYVGPLPKKWPHEVLNLIYVFRVGEGGRVTNRWE